MTGENDISAVYIRDSVGFGVDDEADDTMPVYRVASALIALVEAYQSRERFGGREALDDWV